MTAAVFWNKEQQSAVTCVEKICHILSENGIKPVVPLDSGILGCDELSIDEIYNAASLCVVIGGDGTIIKYAKKAALHGKAVLGINAGRLGYLADIDCIDVGVLSKLATGNYDIENRLMLKVILKRNGVSISEHYCVNDVTICRSNTSRMIDTYVDVCGERFVYRADGIIFSTPTGSTAYSLSAGGPVISPELKAIAMCPICAHSLNSKPVVFSPDIKLCAGFIKHYDCEAYVSFDWQEHINLNEKDVLEISAAAEELKLIRIDGTSFYKRLFNKFEKRSGEDNEE